MIGTLTFHAARNYGSALQAYALQKKIEQLGYKCEIINYRPSAQKQMYSLIDMGRVKPGTIMKNLNNLLHIGLFYKQKRFFENFLKTDLALSNPKYMGEGQTIEQIQKYKAVVCGSDQIWNQNAATRDKSWIYYLDFLHNFKTIAYAPSMGNRPEMVNEDYQLQLISEFDALSVREEALSRYINSKNIHCITTLDPTLLLNQEKWKMIEGTCPINKPYMLFYSINCSRTAARKAAALGKKFGMEVVCPVLHPRLLGTGIQCVAAGPKEFLALIDHAEFVYTNSFHGTAFSVIYRKPFVSVYEDGKRDDRRSTLLNALGLQNHYISQNTEINIGDYQTKVEEEAFQALLQVSEEFLKNALEGTE